MTQPLLTGRAGSRLLVLTLCLAAGTAGAQVRDSRLQRARVDPYTRNEVTALRRAGYVSLGPFAWGDDHDSLSIERGLGDIGLLWLETSHFRIGSSLRPLSGTTDATLDKKIGNELMRLRAKLPRVPLGRPRPIDSWLRLHLFAQRLEDLHDEVTGMLMRSLPLEQRSPEGMRAAFGSEHLTMSGKMLVLILEDEAQLERYLYSFLHLGSRWPARHVFQGNGAWLYATAANAVHGRYVHDTALHCNVVFGVVHNIVSGFRGNYYQVPLWWQEGLAHWFSRRVSPRFLNYTSCSRLPPDAEQSWDWPRCLAKLARQGEVPAVPELVERLDWGRFDFAAHQASWSLVDHLMARDARGFGRFMAAIKGVRTDDGSPPRGQEILPYQVEALRKGWDVTPQQLDQEWRAVLLQPAFSVSVGRG